MSSTEAADLKAYMAEHPGAVIEDAARECNVTPLVAAIPAVVIYNHLSRSIAAHRALLGDASAMVLLLISREGDRGGFRLARAAE
jgi:hypothetical protein